MSMQEELFTAALGLQPPWSVREIAFDPDAGRIDFIVGFERGSRFACPACSTADQPVHDTRAREWRHLNFFQFKAFIKADLPRTRCGCEFTASACDERADLCSVA